MKTQSKFKTDLAAAFRAIADILTAHADLIDTAPSRVVKPTPPPTDLQRFMSEKTFPAAGHVVTFSDLYGTLGRWYAESGLTCPTKAEFRRSLPARLPCGRGTGNRLVIGNISLTPVAGGRQPRLIVVGGRVQRLARRLK